MESSITLVSLAMLKVNIDHGGDYLDYLRPFVIQVLIEKQPGIITDHSVQDCLLNSFGLVIPERAIQLILRRLSRKNHLSKEGGVYRLAKDLPDPGLTLRKAEAIRHIQAVTSGLVEFSNKTHNPFSDVDIASTAISLFLSKFDIQCLRAYLRGTTIPTIEGNRDADIVLVSDFVLHLQKSDPERFESFMVMVQGHMLANALLCPDLQNAPKTYKGVTFYLDTPLLVQALSLEGELKKSSVDGLIRLLQNLGGTVAAFAHSRKELEEVIRGAAEYIGSPNGRGEIVMEARRNGITKSDLLLLAEKIDHKLNEMNITIKDTPVYKRDFQIDEHAFGKVLEDEINYMNPKAKIYDINSVRSIYALRTGKTANNIETCQAVLVTSNSSFAQAAWSFGEGHEESRDVSSVITDYSLANIAWLKAPLGAPGLPETELLAYSYAALRPSKGMLNKFLVEIERLEKQGQITPRDHQLLRSSSLAQSELMHLTLGSEPALTEETIVETLQRVTHEIKQEEDEKYQKEKLAHQKTRSELDDAKSAKKLAQEKIYWRCRKRSKNVSWVAAGLFGLLLLAGVAVGKGLKTSNPVISWMLMVGSFLLLAISIMKLFVSVAVFDLRNKLENWLLIVFLKRESSNTGIDLDEYLR